MTTTKDKKLENILQQIKNLSEECELKGYLGLSILLDEVLEKGKELIT